MKTSAVRGDFSVRRAKYRKYLYRFAVRKKRESVSFPSYYFHDWSKEQEDKSRKKAGPFKHIRNIGIMLPLSDGKSIAEISSPMCIDKACETLSLFEGTHDFTAFAIKKSSRIAKITVDEDSGAKVEVPYKPEFFIRTVDKISIEQVNPPISSHVNPAYDLFDFYTAEFTAQAFFQNQIRRFMGLAFGVGLGRVDIKTIKEMLSNPTFSTGPGGHFLHRMADPKGLHLADIGYCPEDLTDNTDDGKNLPIGPSTEYPTPNIEWDKMANCMKATEPRCGLPTLFSKQWKPAQATQEIKS